MNQCDHRDLTVLLATHNGERYLHEQLSSLQQQKGGMPPIIALDDASEDSTITILEKAGVQLYRNQNRLGAAATFGKLMELCNSSYVLFCDQDDVWMPNRVELLSYEMEQLEQKYGKDTPLLIHTDLTVVDDQLKLIAPSYRKYANLTYPEPSLNQLLMQNVVTGCSTMINRPLLELARPLPQEAMMHDWWIALVASAFGRIHSIAEATILYRQHSSNALGAKGIWNLSRLWDRRGHLPKLIAQAEAFHQRFAMDLSTQQRQLLQVFIDLEGRSPRAKRAAMYRHCFWKQGALRNVAAFCFPQLI